MAGGGGLPPPPTGANSDSFVWVDWYNRLSKYLQAGGIIKWTQIDFTGSDLASIQTRLHSSLQGVQGGIPNTEEYHLSLAQYNTVASLGTLVNSFNTRTGAVTLTSSDVTSALGYTPGTGNGPVFSAYLASNQSISNSTATKVAFATKTFDTNSFFDTTNNRFLPTVAGYYQVNSVVEIIDSGVGSAGIDYYVSIYKNGSEYSRGSRITLATGNYSTISQGASSVISMNGTTDYLEIFVFYTGTTPVIQGSSVLTNFTGALVRTP